MVNGYYLWALVLITSSHITQFFIMELSSRRLLQHSPLFSIMYTTTMSNYLIMAREGEMCVYW